MQSSIALDQSSSVAVSQSFSSYLAHIALYEYDLHEDAVINYVLAERSIFMVLILEGETIQYQDPKHRVSITSSCTFYLAYLDRGSYSTRIRSGKTRILVFTIRPEWMVHKSKSLAHIKPLAAQYQQAGQSFFLPHVGLSKTLIRQVNKLLMHGGADRDDLDIVIGATLTQLLRRYQDLLEVASYPPVNWKDIKADEIRQYVHSCYMDKLEDNRELASRFYVSERQFLRLANIAFGMPLHAYLIKIRMSKAIVKLIGSRRPIYEIAAEVGYHNPHYFSVAFKKYHDISPSEVRGLCL